MADDKDRVWTPREIRDELLAWHPGEELWQLMVDAILVEALVEKLQGLRTPGR